LTTSLSDRQFGVLKVLLAAPVPPPDHGGIATWTRVMRRGMADHPDVELTFVDTAARYRAATNSFLALRLVGGSAQALRDTYRLYRRMKRDRPDVFHLCTSGGPATLKDILLLRIARALHIPSVIHYHMGRLPRILAKGGIEWRMTRRAMLLADAVVPLDGESETGIKTALPHQRVVKLPNMVEIDVVEEICRGLSPPERPAGTFNMIFAGHVVPAKGLRELVQSCLRQHDISLALDLVGPVEPAFRTELEQLAAERDNGGWLRFHGSVSRDETIQHIALTDLLVLPSYSEGMPNVVLEAMACGRAILSTTVGAIPEMLDIGGPQQCGVCVPPRDVDALTAAIAQLLVNGELQREYGRRGRERAMAKYSVPVGCSQLLDLWWSVRRKDTARIPGNRCDG
jgi:glycosyltransferase involved in cell wall biosynthesis